MDFEFKVGFILSSDIIYIWRFNSSFTLKKIEKKLFINDCPLIIKKIIILIKLVKQRKRIYDPKLFFCPWLENTW